MTEPARPAPRPTKRVTVEVTPEAEPLPAVDRWVQRYAEAVAKLEGIPVPSHPTGEAA